ncbi:MAG TPA: ABC transporter transmembrane domain-containing protein [Bacteroidales bacterium]|nr:ABC transporter transmembrane domain-containing protein [Bacteroidales bacterium]HRW85397.1 ABC transporter transmembrane domain-containing protein [Bacteroidales bacterium]
MQEKQVKVSASGLKELLKLYSYLRPFRWKFALGLLCLLIATGLNLMFPKLLGDMVDLGTRGNLTREITITGFTLLAILVLHAVFAYIRTRLFVHVTERTLASIRQSLYNHLIKLPMTFFSERRVGELNSRISADIALLHDTITNTLADFLSQVLVIVGGITFMMITSLKLTLFTLAIVPGMALLAFFTGRAVRRFSKKAQSYVAESNTIVEETLQGIQNVKAFTNERFESERYRGKTDEVARTGIKSGKYQALMSFIGMGIFMSMALVIWRGSVMISKGLMDAGQLFSFVVYSGFIAGNVAGMASVYTRLQRTIGAAENLLLLFDEEAEHAGEIYVHDPSHNLTGRIEFDHVDFNYPSRKDFPVLRDVSFVIEPGQEIALVGPSGAGKTTIAALLLKFYDISSGRILFDGRDSSIFPVTALRSQMAIVMQDVFLFGGTIRENIAYGKQNAIEDEIVDAAIRANAWNFISAFPDKLDTVVGERGVQLSGGQRQRIAIARAVLRDPKILILDEATSSLDSESERLVQEALDKLMKGRTSVVIAHRLSTVRNADKIIVLNEGRVIEEGTHVELISNGSGLYKTLTELQFTT